MSRPEGAGRELGRSREAPLYKSNMKQPQDLMEDLLAMHDLLATDKKSLDEESLYEEVEDLYDRADEVFPV